MMREPTHSDREEARKVFRGTSELFFFGEGGKLQNPKHVTNSTEYSQKHRGVQAAVIDLLLGNDPEARRFLLAPKEAATDDLNALGQMLSDMSDDDPRNTLDFIETDMKMAQHAEVSDHESWINCWADILRCEQKHGQEENTEDLFPIEQHREDYPLAFAIYDEHREAIEQRAVDREKVSEIREEFHQPAPQLRSSEAFWDSTRIRIYAEPSLVQEVATRLAASRRAG